ncbi:hypothetical protein AALB47_11605 [Lachnospiraceae bacterium 54-11]
MKDYMTDEELELFIEHMEQRELYAPKHMKEQILNQAFPKQTVEVLPKSGGGRKQASLLAYRIKIIAGMAAAIIMLMILPMQREIRGYESEMERRLHTESMREQEDDGKEHIDLNTAFNEGTWKINRKINSWFDRINNWGFDNLYEDGGIYYED